VNIPNGEHWAIVSARRIVVPGDQRSRDAPGHGYPEHTEVTTEYEAFADKAAFEAELTRRASIPYYNNSLLRGLHVTETFVARPAVTVQIEKEGRDG